MTDDASLKEDQQNLEYIREHKMHHIFEELAGFVLKMKPPDVKKFLIEVLKSQVGEESTAERAKADKEEETKPKYDPRNEDRKGMKKPAVTIGIFGIANAGKTTLISAMGGNIDTETVPTIGFTPVRMANERFDIVFYDLGGGKKFRGIWPSYFADVHGIIYVVDGSDSDNLDESLQALQVMQTDERATGKPLLLFSNKNDKSTFMSADELSKKFSIDDLQRPAAIKSICAIDNQHESHKNIDVGIEWLISNIADQYEELAARVKEQVAVDRANRKKAFEEQKERVRKEKEARGEGDN